MNPVIDPRYTYLSGADIIRILELSMQYGKKFSTLDEALERSEIDGIEVYFLDMKNLNGAMIIGTRPYVFVNNHLSELEQTHVLLHEKAHYRLHAINRFCNVFICRNSLIDYQEMEADYLAFLLSSDYLKIHCKWNFFREDARLKNFD